jgi:hypothetical protein
MASFVPPPLVVDVVDFGLWLTPAYMVGVAAALIAYKEGAYKQKVRGLLPMWLMGLLAAAATIAGSVYGTWAVWRVYDSGSIIWQSAMGIQLVHVALVAFLWPAAHFYWHRWAGVAVLVVLTASAATVDGLYWALFGLDKASVYSAAGPSVYIVYVVLLAYVLGVSVAHACRGTRTTQKV